MDYQKAYIYLFNAMTDALEELEGKSVENAASILREAQCQTEEWYMDAKEEKDE